MHSAMRLARSGRHTAGLCRPLPPGLLLAPPLHMAHARTIMDLSLPAFLWKSLILFGLAGSYFVYQVYRRSGYRQCKSMREAWARRPPKMLPQLYCERPIEEGALRAYLKNMPGMPTVIVGPQGCGKDNLVLSVLKNVKLVNRLDLRERAITDVEEFSYYFADKMGFEMPAYDFLSRWLLSERSEDQAALPPKELDSLFFYLRQTCLEMKNQGWKDGIPVIHISGMDNLLANLRSKQEIATLEEQLSGAPHYTKTSVLSKFLDFSLSVTEEKLCHIIITCENTFSRLVLDAHPAWLSSREILQLDYAREAVIGEWFVKVVNPYLQSLGRKPVDEEEVSYLYSCLGGNFTDIMALLSSIERGQPLQIGVYILVSEAVSKVVRHLEHIQEAAAAARPKQPEVEILLLQRYARFWGMMQLLSEATPQNPVTRSELLGKIFSLNPAELDHLEEHKLIKFSVNKPVWLSAQLAAAVKSKKEAGSEQGVRWDKKDWLEEWFQSESSMLGYISQWTRTESGANIKTEEIIGSRQAEEASKPRSKQKLGVGRSIVVTPFSPRIAMAFDLLMGKRAGRGMALSGKYAVIRQGVRDRLKRETLALYIKDMMDEQVRVQKRKESVVSEQHYLLLLDQQARERLGEEFTRQLAHVKKDMRQIDERLDQLDLRLRVAGDILAELDDMYWAIKKEIKHVVQGMLRDLSARSDAAAATPTDRTSS